MIKKLIGLGLVACLIGFMAFMVGCGGGAAGGGAASPTTTLAGGTGTTVSGTATAATTDIATLTGASISEIKAMPTDDGLTAIASGTIKVFSMAIVNSEIKLGAEVGSGTTDDNGAFTFSTTSTLDAGAYYVQCIKTGADNQQITLYGILIVTAGTNTYSVNINPAQTLVAQYVTSKVVEAVSAIASSLTFLSESTTQTLLESVATAALTTISSLDLDASVSFLGATATVGEGTDLFNNASLQASIDALIELMDSGDLAALKDALAANTKLDQGTSLTQADAEQLVKDVIAGMDSSKAEDYDSITGTFVPGLAAALRQGVTKTITEIRTAADSARFTGAGDDAIDPATGQPFAKVTIESAATIVTKINEKLAYIRAGTSFPEQKAFTIAFPPGNREDVTADTELNMLKQTIIYEAVVFSNMTAGGNQINPMKLFHELDILKYVPDGIVHAEVHTQNREGQDGNAVEGFLICKLGTGESVVSAKIKDPDEIEYILTADPYSMGVPSIAEYRLAANAMFNGQSVNAFAVNEIIEAKEGTWIFTIVTSVTTYSATADLTSYAAGGGSGDSITITGLKVDGTAVADQNTAVAALSGSPTISWLYPSDTLPNWAEATGGYHIVIQVEKYVSATERHHVWDNGPREKNILGGTAVGTEGSFKLPCRLIAGDYRFYVRCKLIETGGGEQFYGQGEGMFTVP
ncbi:MAG: hypothetical protein ABH823_04740 [bacterium]